MFLNLMFKFCSLNSDLSQFHWYYVTWVNLSSCFVKYPRGTRPQISLMLTEFCQSCSEIKRQIRFKHTSKTWGKWRYFCTLYKKYKLVSEVRFSVKLQRLNTVSQIWNCTIPKQQQEKDIDQKHIPSSSKLHHALAKPLAFLHVPWIFF